MESTRRLFVALVLGEELGARVASAVGEALGRRREGLSLYAGGDLHLTLWFLGAVAPRIAGELEEWLGTALSGAEAPHLRLTTGGSFPARGRERILWVGLEDESAGQLGRVHERTCEACGAAGFRAEERPWWPHVTVGRVRRGRAVATNPIPGAFYEMNLGLEWKPSAVSIVQSLPGTEERYRVVRSFPLGTPPDTN